MAYKKAVLTLVKDRLKTLAELPLMTRYFFEEPVINHELLTTNKQLMKLSADEQKTLLETSAATLNAIAWTPEHIQDALNQLLHVTEQKPGILFSLIRIATTWAPFSPELPATLALLGKEHSLARLQTAIDSL